MGISYYWQTSLPEATRLVYLFFLLELSIVHYDSLERKMEPVLQYCAITLSQQRQEPLLLHLRKGKKNL